MTTVHLLDYVAGNVRSLVNAIELLGHVVEWIKTPEEISRADVGFDPSSNTFLYLWTFGAVSNTLCRSSSFPVSVTSDTVSRSSLRGASFQQFTRTLLRESRSWGFASAYRLYLLARTRIPS